MDIQIVISDIEVKALENELLDINEWVQAAVTGKINHCTMAMLAEWQPKLFADPTVDSIPADTIGFINLVVARDDYKTAAQREQE